MALIYEAVAPDVVSSFDPDEFPDPTYCANVLCRPAEPCDACILAESQCDACGEPAAVLAGDEKLPLCHACNVEVV